MGKIKTQSEYAHLINLSNNLKDKLRYNNKLFISKKLGAVIATDGCKLIADRRVYEKLSVLAALLDSETVLNFNSETGLFEKSESESESVVDSIERIVPTSEQLTHEKYKRVRMQLPDMLKHVSKKLNCPLGSFVLTETRPLLAAGFYPDAVGFNSHYLAPHSGEELDFHFDYENRKSAFLIVPAGQVIESAPWFSILMPVSKSDKDYITPSYI